MGCAMGQALIQLPSQRLGPVLFHTTNLDFQMTKRNARPDTVKAPRAQFQCLRALFNLRRGFLILRNQAHADSLRRLIAGTD
jgi:hypothetical protein